MSMEEIDRAFYDLTVKERNYWHTRATRLEAELIRAQVRLGEIGVGALLSTTANPETSA